MAGVSVKVRSFLNFKPDRLHLFNSSKLKNTDPRGWERVSIIQDSIPEHLKFEVFSGCVDDGPAAEYKTFCELFDKLPKPEDVLSSPETEIGRAHV